MNRHVQVPTEVQRAIAAYLYRRRGTLVEISDAVRAIRRGNPHLRLSDRQLGDFIAAEAVKIHCAVFFDGHSPKCD
ncbi:hypothetical protein [Ensifer sp. LCM 4579]|uniref:hypothetical protein n=1 Tax=Ensifer sp. LCM 4579 TaxID=1848292 RepID=UPI0008DA9EBC|nr:hypothetical protein [Ensifer sp. LCM 4579]OHV80913.1 hypothetical protein LCM4579_20735 [Ensifer sp. LCM 4579]